MAPPPRPTSTFRYHPLPHSLRCLQLSRAIIIDSHMMLYITQEPTSCIEYDILYTLLLELENIYTYYLQEAQTPSNNAGKTGVVHTVTASN